jgi:hypothetical protein
MLYIHLSNLILGMCVKAVMVPSAYHLPQSQIFRVVNCPLGVSGVGYLLVRLHRVVDLVVTASPDVYLQPSSLVRLSPNPPSSATSALTFEDFTQSTPNCHDVVERGEESARTSWRRRTR